MGSASLPFLSPFPPSGAGGQGMGAVVSSSHIVSAAPSSSGEDFSHSAPAPAWGPSHGRQFSTNFSNVSPSHRLQLFMNFPGWVLPTGYNPSGTGCSGMGSPRGHSFLQASPCSGMGLLPRATCGDLLHCGPPCAARAQPASPWSALWAAREDSAPVSQTPPLPPSSLTLMSAELFLSHHLAPLSWLPFYCRFFPLLNTLSQRCYHHRRLAWPWPAVGLS